jgi:hypothetical protein
MDYNLYPFKEFDFNNIDTITYISHQIKFDTIFHLVVERNKSQNVSNIVDLELYIETIWKSCQFRPKFIPYRGYIIDSEILIKRKHFIDTKNNHTTAAEHRTRRSL